MTDKLWCFVVHLTHSLQHGSIPKVNRGWHLCWILWFPRKFKMSPQLQHTRMSLAQCVCEGHWAEFEPARMILADSTSRGLVNTWWSQTWHSLFHTRWARHGLHAPRGMQTRPFGLHKVLVVYTAYAFYVYTEFTHSLHALSKHVNHE